MRRVFHPRKFSPASWLENLANRPLAAAILAACLFLASPGFAENAPASVSQERPPGAFQLIRKSEPAPIFVGGEDDEGVLIAVRNLHDDLASVGGKRGRLFETDVALSAKQAVIIGTLGRSRLIDSLIEMGKLDASAIENEWEAFIHTVVEAPFPGVEQALVIAGSDRRGTIFGVYDLAEKAGVSPWSWWADVPVKPAKNLYVSPGARVEKPAVKYRGIFLNDERPALQGWAEEKFGGLNHKFYENVSELILRLKGNYLWPAMWGNAFYDDDPMNAVIADRMGVVIGTSHHEPLARAHVEWARYGEGPWDYARNSDVLRSFWREGMERRGDHDAIITIGMRGDGDEAMTEGTAIDLLERIVADQRKIIAETTGKEASETPQIWALYKEVQDYYDQGMDVPDDVTLLFADDNWGNIRRLSEPGANRAGGYGVYYHFDYVGGPRNYKWLNTTQIERVWEQMNLAWEYGAKEIWIVNVGDLKPMEFPIDFFLDYAWNPEDLPLERMTDYPRDWAAEQFGEKHAAEIGRMLSAYTKYNARRKPELLDPETYSLVAYDEAARIAAKYGDLAREADALRKKLPPQYDDAYMQLVWHPIQASANLNALYLAAANNRLCAEQARLCANKWADETEALFARDTELTRIYHEEIAEGKWRHLMDQTHIGYTYWQQPDQNTMPPVVRVSGPINADFGVAFDRRREALTTESPALEAAIVLDRNSALGPLKATLFNRRDAAFDFSVETPPWLKAEPAAGRVTDAREISFAVDWTKMPAGETWSDVKVTRKREDGAQSLAFPVRALNREPTGKGGAFVEADGYIAFFAENHARAVNSGGAEWTRIPNLGRERSGMTAFPRAGGAIALEASSPRLEFDFHAFTAGDVAVEVTLAPTLDFKDKGGLKYAVSIDDEPPTVVNVNADASEEAWDESVANYAHQRTSRHEISSAGAHTLKLWLIDPALVFEKITIRSGETPQSYLGPPQSLRASDVEQTVDAED